MPGGWLAGVDEAGRGPWAGPVVAAAVVLNPEQAIVGLDDSKRLSARRREALAPEIQHKAWAWAVAEASVEEIDQLNILQATLLAMRRAVEALRPMPDAVWVDGNRAPRLAGLQVHTLVGGDRQMGPIAAASILAKVHRDRLCMALDQQFSGYGFAQHKGYGTPQHQAALLALGPCEAHRRSFAPVRRLLGRSR